MGRDRRAHRRRSSCSSRSRAARSSARSIRATLGPGDRLRARGLRRLRGADRALGQATFAGFIKLDDTATWMALTDRVMEHGRSLSGLAPSTYEATLAFNLGKGYPIGAFLPLGVARELVGQDVAWVIQPYMASLGAMLALVLWELPRALVGLARLRAVVGFVAAQAALLLRLLPLGRDQGGDGRSADRGDRGRGGGRHLAARARSGPIAVLAVMGAAAVGVLSGGGAVWLAAAAGRSRRGSRRRPRPRRDAQAGPRLRGRASPSCASRVILPGRPSAPDLVAASTAPRRSEPVRAAPAAGGRRDLAGGRLPPAAREHGRHRHPDRRRRSSRRSSRARRGPGAPAPGRRSSTSPAPSSRAS